MKTSAHARAWLGGIAPLTLIWATPVLAQTVPATAAPVSDDTRAEQAGADAPIGDIVVTGSSGTRAVTQISGAEIQKILPGISPLKAIQTLPGVTYPDRRSVGQQRAEHLAVHPRLQPAAAWLHARRGAAG